MVSFHSETDLWGSHRRRPSPLISEVNVPHLLGSFSTGASSDPSVSYRDDSPCRTRVHSLRT